MTTLPDSLVRYRTELEAAIGRDLQARRRRRARGVALRLAAVAGVVAAVAVGAFAALPGGPGARLVESASAAQRAASALAAEAGSIVHVNLVVEQRSADGTRSSWRAESWQQTSPPYELREIVTGPDGERVATATPQPVTAQPLREQVLLLLRSGRLTESGRSTVDGRDTISFAWENGGTRYEYTVDAATYEPVRWRLAAVAGGSETTVTFETYEVLPSDR